MRLQDKVILITGSTTGIGRAMARSFVQEGAQVLVHGLDPVLGEQVVAELGPRSKLHIDDLSDPASAGRLVAAAHKAFGKLDAVVNNAARIVRSTLSNTTAEFFDGVMAVNVRAPMLLIQAARELLKQTQGCVLNIGSVNGHCGEATLLDYSVSKGALITLSRNLADALGPERIRVNHFNLGWVLTENEYQYKLAEGLPADWPEHVPRTTAPWGRLMRPEEIAGAAVFWVGDESRPISGSVVDLEQYPLIGRNPIKEVD